MSYVAIFLTVLWFLAVGLTVHSSRTDASGDGTLGLFYIAVIPTSVLLVLGWLSVLVLWAVS